MPPVAAEEEVHMEKRLILSVGREFGSGGQAVAAKEGHVIGWGKYCKYAAPATALVVLLSMIMIYIRYF